MKRLIFFFGLLTLAGCKKDDPAPSGPSTPLVTDPRDVYTGNYHFTIARQTHVMFPGHMYNDTTFFNGTVTKIAGNGTSVVIAYGTHGYDTLYVSPDNTGYFISTAPTVFIPDPSPSRVLWLLPLQHLQRRQHLLRCCERHEVLS